MFFPPTSNITVRTNTHSRAKFRKKTAYPVEGGKFKTSLNFFSMRDKGQFNDLYSYACNCGHKNTFEAEEYPNMLSIQICRGCGEVVLVHIDGKKHRSKLKDSTKHLIGEIQQVFLGIGETMTARGVFYQLTTRNAIEKTEEGYNQVCNVLGQMRWRGWLSWNLIVDETRSFFGATTYENAKHALDHWSRAYRRQLWQDTGVCVQVYVEKLALAGIMRTITDEYDVPLFPMRGFNSLSYIRQIAEQIKHSKKHSYLYHFGDYDPSGVCAAETFQNTLVNMGATNFTFARVAVHPWQIEQWRLPTRPTKQTDKRAKNFEGDSCELDAIPPAKLRGLVEDVIFRHISREEVQRVKDIEEHERNVLRQLVL